MPIAAAIPAIIGAAGSVGGALLAGRKGGAEKAQLSQGAGLQQDLLKMATQEKQIGLPAVSSAANFWQSLMSGDRAKVESVLGPTESDISKTFAGVTRGLGEFSPRGGGTTTAAASSRFQEAGELARARETLAAEAPRELGALGAQLLGQATGQLTGAAEISQGQLNWLLDKSTNAQNIGLAAGKGLGALLYAGMLKGSGTSSPQSPFTMAGPETAEG